MRSTHTTWTKTVGVFSPERWKFMTASCVYALAIRNGMHHKKRGKEKKENEVTYLTGLGSSSKLLLPSLLVLLALLEESLRDCNVLWR